MRSRSVWGPWAGAGSCLRSYVHAMFRLPLLVLLAALLVAAGAPSVASAKSCGLSSAEQGGSRPSSLGATYVTSLRASGTSCGRAKRVVRAFNRCRPGKAGRCNRRVRGYSCSENRSNGVGQYQSTTKCRNGGRTVRFTYTQNT